MRNWISYCKLGNKFLAPSWKITRAFAPKRGWSWPRNDRDLFKQYLTLFISLYPCKVNSILALKRRLGYLSRWRKELACLFWLLIDSSNAAQLVSQGNPFIPVWGDFVIFVHRTSSISIYMDEEALETRMRMVCAWVETLQDHDSRMAYRLNQSKTTKTNLIHAVTCNAWISQCVNTAKHGTAHVSQSYKIHMLKCQLRVIISQIITIVRVCI
jgi:hypothetical protein